MEVNQMMYEALERFVARVKYDWYDFTTLGFAAKVKYYGSVVLYHIGFTKVKPDPFYSMMDFDMDFTETKNLND